MNNSISGITTSKLGSTYCERIKMSKLLYHILVRPTIENLGNFKHIFIKN